MTFLLSMVIRYKLTFLFWSYMAVMGISALITKWYTGEEDKNKFTSYSVHTAMVCAFTLFLWGGFHYLSTWLSNLK